MKVFISWSGERSRQIGEILKSWIPSVLQGAKPYFSPDDVGKGTRWASEVGKELDASQMGLLVVTPENQEAPWLIFEAGALGKNLDKSKVCPLLFGDMEPTDLKGPLVQFQSARFSKDEIKRVLKMMNAGLPKEMALEPDVLDRVFDRWWDDLDKSIAAVPIPDEKVKKRPERDMLEEILGLVRISTTRPQKGVSPKAWRDILTSVKAIMSHCSLTIEVEKDFKLMRSALQHIERHADNDSLKLAIYELLEEVELRITVLGTRPKDEKPDEVSYITLG